MLSRVAAVKAPRTDYRRRVTGSSERRREGKKSEPRRPNMSRRVFTSAVLLLVMIFCGTCGATQAVEPSSDPKLQWKGISVGDVTVKSLSAPGLLKVGNDVFAVAEAQCKKNDGEDTFTGVASQLLTETADNEPEEVLNDVKDTLVLEEGISSEKTRVDVSRPTAVVDGDDIYMLVGKYSRKGGQESGAVDWGLLLVKGEVSGEDESNKQIDWKDTNAVPKKPMGDQQNSLKRLIGGGGSGLKMEDGTLVFPVEGTKEKDDNGKDEKTVSLIILKDAESWTLSKGMSDDGCSDPSVVEWKDKLMMMTACDGGRRRVYVSGDKGESWTEALGTLSRVWGNNKKEGEGKAVGSGFTAATIGVGDDEKKNVMLVTLPVYPKENQKENKKGELHLWLTDNTHIVDIGPVSGEGEDVAASALLHKSVEGETNEEKKELIALYEKKKGDAESSLGMVSVLLTEQLQRVKDVLATWKEVDGRVSELCPSEGAVKGPSTDSACSATVKITDGLVGFLSGNFSDDTWRDEYLGVNATVKKGTKEGVPAGVAETAGSSDGVTFRGAWAEWPVGRQGENQLYHFANYNFTLVATVSIDGVPKQEGPIPLMGAILKNAENPVLLGLSYNNKEKKWTLLCGDGKKTEHSSTWETKTDTTRYQVAIVLQNEKQGSAYVDGQRVLENVQCQLEGKEDKNISHFYIGGDGSNSWSQEDVSVTVRNVLLYNRPLDDSEITALNTIKAPITPPKETNAQEVVLPSPGGTPHAGQEPLNGGEGADGGSASPSAVSASTTSSGSGQSVNQLAPGKPPDGNADVDVSPSSSGNPTVGEGSADTIQGDGPHTPSVGNTPAAADTNVLTAKGEGHDGPALTRDVSVSSGADGETAGGTDAQEEEGIHPQDRDVNATALGSSLGNLSQGNNSDAGTVCGRRVPPLLLLLLGLWGFAAQ
ncbi:putative trans-sialidase, Group VI [Trypanosoma cruzi]|uniref:Trans-sialidase, putative n=2 Tax=Trypanosoma cruzi TaxID=5693 RepID=Q4D9F2_TRYCC|nr:trans-sialidase, putative [Trypanosoma cruzi]EAN89153.1 trans-sialidase, putative [Trypanosoma cruzi]PWV21074.1 putative trans-sialidase, Group VI [Trypanosoma cruzi]RNC43194.1 putative trans-sialidase [Trypanosoma cruzi]|eukprot:XP_811004.1 trans-sialidase [Trypanosoma cruzi strain CL Brener]